MTVSLLEVLAAARAHAAPLAAESAGYLLLAVADHLVSSPRAINADDIELHTDGSVRLRSRGGAVGGDLAEQVARRLLARTLEVASSVGPALRRAAERREPSGLDGLVRELEVALIPVNRSAARRALSRVHRETERARDQGKLEALLRAEQELPVAAADVVAMAADFPDTTVSATPAPALPVVAAAPAPSVAVAPRASAPPPPRPAPVAVASPEPPRATAPRPLVDLVLSPPPLPAEVAVPVAAARAVAASEVEEPASEEPVLTKPEPVVERARERGSSTPRLGTVVTAQTLAGEEQDRTERAPAVALEEQDDDELDVPIEVELEPELLMAEEQQPFVDPSPSRLPDVLTAMVKLHAGLEPDEAPTRLRDVVTALRPVRVVPTPVPVEVVDPAVHEALTWNPGPVVAKAVVPASSVLQPPPPPAPIPEAEPVFEVIPDLPVEPAPLPESLLIGEPVELSPYAPAVLPARASDVSELLDSFHVTSAAEERELRAALKEMAGLDLTPLPHPYAQGE